ncbi:MAG TPA: response regulator transcription factor [Patescibacteria group bacterium]|nr:response regulator transcription factor [Patescibacteria group bacterium]
MPTTILLVESKNTGGKSLEPALSKSDLIVIVADTGSKAHEILSSNRPDLVIVDASVMRSNGVRICRRIRSVLATLPIIHCRDIDDVLDTSANADVYLARPFTARKVLNRIRVLLPVDDLKEEIVKAGRITFYPSKRSVDVDGRGERRLTPKLADMLDEFLRHPNEVLERDYLMVRVWKTNYFGDTRTLDVHMRWLREIIERNPAKPEIVKTVRSVGYIFAIPPDTD